MPYFKSKNVLFVHIPKNAGRSIEAALLPPSIYPKMGRRSFLNQIARGLLKRTASRVPSEYLMGTLDVALASQHLTLSEIRLLGILPREVIDKAVKFCVVRNPYDRAISSIFHFNPSLPREKPSVEQALEVWFSSSGKDHNQLAHRRRQIDFARDTDGSINMDYLIRFERLEEEFALFNDRFGLGVSNLGRIGKTCKPTYRSLYSDRSRSLVKEAFYEDIEAFGYEF